MSESSSEKVLLVDDDPKLLRLVEFYLRSEGFETISAATGAEALEMMRTESPVAVVLDLLLPDISGTDLLAEFQKNHPTIPVVVLTAKTDVEEVVECMRLGAVDYVRKPFDETRLVTCVRNASCQGRLLERVESLSSRLREREGFGSILGRSRAIRRTIHLLERAASSDVTLLLQGESGTGKEVAARAVHTESTRRENPFIVVNCGAIPEGLIESELFGHERGSFTGATGMRVGCFEQADTGTIFLDEIGELRADLQVKLLRVLQERQVQRVGGSTTKSVDVRVIAATNRDLKAEVAVKNFREDLYYRLAVFPVLLPALRERESDLVLLARAFVERFAKHDGRRISGFTPEAQRVLESYAWPGNVRELENVVERAVILEDGPSISAQSLPDEIVLAFRAEQEDASRLQSVGPEEQPVVARSAVVAELLSHPAHPDGFENESAGGSCEIVPFEEEERRIILRALELTRWNVQEASKRLGIGRATIYRKIERYGLRAAEARAF